MSTAKEAKTTESPRRRLNCMPCFDALWFCY
ncbi:E3 SUMO-protein ligase SIZ1 [Bienertia sinuspersici]